MPESMSAPDTTLNANALRRQLSDSAPRVLAALSARCLRRVQPLLVHFCPTASRRTLRAILDAISCCELRAYKPLSPSILHGLRSKRAAYRSGGLGKRAWRAVCGA